LERRNLADGLNFWPLVELNSNIDTPKTDLNNSPSMKLKPIAAAFFLALPISAYSDIKGSDYSEFTFEDLGYGIGLSGDDKSIISYGLSFDISSEGIITGSGTRNDFGSGNSMEVTSIINVTVVDGKLGTPTTQTTSESFTRRISGRNVTLIREVNTKTVPVVITLSDGGLIKGGWSFNQEREQTAVWRRGWVYSWKVTDEWYSGQAWAWYNDKTGTGMLGD
jgi:hypothetical protein